MHHARLIPCALFTLLACTTNPPPRTTRWVVPPLFEPKAFRIETVLYDVPLAQAEKLGTKASPTDALLGLRVDEFGTQLALEKSADAIPRKVMRPPATVTPGELVRIPPRPIAGDPTASDRLELDVRASISNGFAPVELDIALVWRDRSGALLGRTSGNAPQPKDHWIETLCVPPAATQDLAIFGFVRAVPLFDDASPIASLDPGDGIQSPKGQLSNVGDSSIRFAIDSTGDPVLVELGSAGRATWVGDDHALSVQGGADARFVCRGRSNTLTVTFGTAEGGGKLELLGADNRCINVENGFGRTEFVSQPGVDGGQSRIDLGREPGNTLHGPWRPFAP